MGSGVARRDPSYVNPKVNLCMHTIFLFCRSEVYVDSKYIWVHDLTP